MSDVSFTDRVRIRKVIEDVLASLAVDTLFFGLFSGMCAASLWMLITQLKSHPRRNLPGRIGSLVVLCLMYVLAFSYFGVDAAATVSGVKAGAVDPYLLEYDVTNTFPTNGDVKGILLFMQITLANGFLVYRLFEVWGRNLWVLILPTLLSLATFGAGASMLDKLVHLPDNFPADVRTTLFYSLNSATSGLCAILIIVRLVVRRSRLHTPPLLPRPAAVLVDLIVQSAVVYVAASIGLAVFVAADLSKPRPKWIIGGMPSFIGITASAILLWELKMLKTEPENDSDTEKLNAQTA